MRSLLAADGAAPANPLRWREAVDHHAARTPVPRSAWDAMEAEARQRAFTVSGIASTQLLTDVHAAIGDAVANGTTLRDFKRQMEARLTSEWGAPNAARVETIFRTNVQTAYNAGRYAQMSQPTAMALRPYWAFQAILDKRTTDTCAPLDKVTRPVGDAFWDSHWPPLHFNCRSTVTSLSRREFDRLAASPTGVKTEAAHADGRPVKGPLPGFGGAPDLPGVNLRPPRTTPPDVLRVWEARRSRPITGAAGREDISGTAKFSRYDGQFRPNPDGAVRTREEALTIAARHGIHFDPDLHEVIVDQKPGSDYARYFDLKRVVPGQTVAWSDLTNRAGKVVVRINPQTLTSDEAIVAALAHELHESDALRERFERNGGHMSSDLLRQLVESSPVSLHNAAWDFADEIITRLRAAGLAP